MYGPVDKKERRDQM